MITVVESEAIPPVLSICINTRNRGNVISETIDSIILQILPGIEIVVIDGASEDNTQQILHQYASKHSFLKYIRSEIGLGVDDGYDMAVASASGRYCWLMTDDDLIMQGALDAILEKLNGIYDLIVLNVSCFSKDFSADLKQRLFRAGEDVVYSKGDFGRFLGDVGYGLSYIGCVVIKRSLWNENDRSKYYGTYFIHMGVICESSKINEILFLHKPLIKYRSGNSSWTAKSFEIWYLKWPKLVWSFSQFPEAVRNSVVSLQPWRRSLTLLKSRAMNEYNYKIFSEHLATEASRWRRLVYFLISKLPIIPLNLSILLFCLLFKRSGVYTLYNLMVSSPRPELSRRLIWLFGLKLPSIK